MMKVELLCYESGT